MGTGRIGDTEYEHVLCEFLVAVRESIVGLE